LTLYPNPVRLRLIRTDPRFSELAKRGKWRLAYLSSTTLSEIRDLSELQGESKIRLERELEVLKQESEKRSLHLPVNRTPIFDLETPYLRNKGFEPEILAKAKDFFLEFEKKEGISGRPPKIIFYATLYLAYRLFNKPKRLEDIAETGQLDSKRLWHSVRMVETILEMKPR